MNRPKPDPAKEQAYREEANRLKALSRDMQRQVIAIHRATAADPSARKADRDAARHRAAALERYLGLRKRK
jgi:hypothetical protein